MVMNGKPKQNKKRNKKGSAKGASNLKLSQCALKYALALSAPFDPLCMNACNPSFRTMNTQKVSCYGSFTATIGTAGTGWVAFTPTLTNQGWCAYHTSATYTGGAALDILTALNTFRTGVVPYSLSNLPYSTAQLQSQNFVAPASGVLVSMGVRITYTGTTLNEGGMYHSYVDNTHASVAGVALPTITSRQETLSRGIDRNPLELVIGSVDSNENDVEIDNRQTCYYPFSAGETTFNNNHTVSDPGGILASPPISVVFFNGTPGNTFHVDIVEHVEYIGTIPSASYTPHDSDSVGAAKVQSAAVGLSALKKAEPKYVGSAWPFMFKALQTVAIGVAEVVIPQTAAAVSSLLTRH